MGAERHVAQIDVPAIPEVGLENSKGLHRRLEAVDFRIGRMTQQRLQRLAHVGTHIEQDAERARLQKALNVEHPEDAARKVPGQGKGRQ